MVEMRNMDKNSPGQWNGDYGYILRHTIIPAIQKVTGVTVNQNFTVGGPAAASSTTPSVSSLSTKVSTALSGLGNVGPVVLVIIVLGILFAFFRRK